MVLVLVFDKVSRRVLGIQGMNAMGDALAARINAVAPLLARGATIEDISNLEVLYSPPFAAAMDIVNVVGNVAENILEGRFVPMSQEEFEKLWEERDDDEVYFIDARVGRDAVPMIGKHPEHWHNIPQDEISGRVGEIPGDKKIVLICNTGLRSYEAQLNLASAGRSDTCSVMGGLSSAKKLGIDI